MSGNYFFIDGSALTAQVRQLWREDESLKGRKLCPRHLADYFMEALPDLHGGAYKRMTFYFPVGDDASVAEHLISLDHRNPGEVKDLNFKYCGQKLKKSADFTAYVESELPPKFRDRFSKSEKGIDIEICCDAFRLAAASRIERLFLFTNDDDFVPFCRMIKEYGANISIIHLSGTVNANVSLLREADSYDVVPKERLQEMFLPVPEMLPPATIPPASALKPDAEPSDLVLGGTGVAGESEEQANGSPKKGI